MPFTFFERDPLWYKDAIKYELHVRTFFDSNNDGIGDFRGLTKKIDYLKELGINAIWLLPFYPSPLKDDGYDIADYYKIHPDYGTLRDFKQFLKVAHGHGLRVITELVLNHTSSDHQWFQKARRAKPGSAERDRYVWSDSPEKFKDARIIFKDFESSNWTWDSVAGAYFWHRFYSHQPDLNFESELVKREVEEVVDFWLSLGVDGVRLDAVPYLFERDGTNCENLPETHAYLRSLRKHVDEKFEEKMFLAEANQWPEDAAAYFGKGDECHMAFHFPVMPRIFMAVQMEDSYPISDILNSTPAIPDSCQWAIFLRNHDELTLEMVTDEERDYMYRFYAKDPRAKINVGIRRRLAPLMGNNRKKIELLNILLFSLPGTPVLYYGDEIGMGDNFYLGDRNGVRTPMQWSSDRNAGFSGVNPQQLYLPVIIDPDYHFELINVENQGRNLSSLLWWMKRVIAMRKKYKAFSRGTIQILSSNNPKVLTFIREFGDERILVAVNLSRFTQVVEIDLAKFNGQIPEEVFSHNQFPQIQKKPYTLMLGPYLHYWLLLRNGEQKNTESEEEVRTLMRVENSWQNIFKGKWKEYFEDSILPHYISQCRWFGAKSRKIRRIRIVENAIVQKNSPSNLLILEIEFTEGSPDYYFLPVSFRRAAEAQSLKEEHAWSIIASLSVDETEGVLYDSVCDEEFRSVFLYMLSRRRKIKGMPGEFMSKCTVRYKQFNDTDGNIYASRPLAAEQSNTSIMYDNKFVLKFYRHIEEGANPEYEILKNLTEKTTFRNMPAYVGTVQYSQQEALPGTVALVQEFVENVGDAWTFSKDIVSRYFEQILSHQQSALEIPQKYPSFFDSTIESVPSVIRDLIGDMYLELIMLLGKRTGELHLALSSITDDEAVSPEPFSLLYQRSVYQGMQNLARKTLRTLRKNIKNIPEEYRKEAKAIAGSEQKIITRMQKILKKKIAAMKIRIHGDYHLGQVLYTGKDFFIIDYEGEPARPIGERRLKHSPFKDIAGMIRSFHYVAYGALLLRSSVRSDDIVALEPWIEPWYRTVSGLYLSSYLETVSGAAFVPKKKDELKILLETFLLEKAAYELGYELNNRPAWVLIPLRGMQHVLKNRTM
jgi:maltose alpha-D-glucosyltransferase/alpha-amylase